MNRARTSMGVPMSAADESARQLAQGIRQLIGVVNENTAAVRATMGQFFGSAELRKRWNCSEERLSELLRVHAGLTVSRGHRISVSLPDVLLIDAALLREYEARKAVARGMTTPALARTQFGEVAHAS